jgi:transcriptional regulator with XRE-family HTH domain
MKIENDLTNNAVLDELGRRLERYRLDLQLTQAQVAEQAGIGKRTLERIEAGKDTQLSSLIRILRVLHLLDGMERLVPEPGPRPMDLLKLKGKERQRAPSRKIAEPDREWQWGDEE